jgi:hypothetical protein
VTIFNHTFVIIDVIRSSDMSIFDKNILIADVTVPPPGKTDNFEHCIKIVNLDRYPDFYILVGDSFDVDIQQVDLKFIIAKPDICIKPEYSSVRVAAIQKNLVDRQDLIEQDGNTFIQSSKIKKDLILTSENTYPPQYLPGFYSGSKIEFSARIEKLDRQSLVVSEFELTPPLPIWTIVVPLIGVGIVGWLIFRKRHKKLDE